MYHYRKFLRYVFIIGLQTNNAQEKNESLLISTPFKKSVISEKRN